jgi:hypothetical protein
MTGSQNKRRAGVVLGIVSAVAAVLWERHLDRTAPKVVPASRA